jgi:hypothetical protein
MKIISLYRRGYLLGKNHANLGLRKQADWEVQFRNPVTWVFGVDNDSFLRGYNEGYRDAMAVAMIR